MWYNVHRNMKGVILMITKYYSEVLDRYFNTKTDCLNAERKYEKEQMKKKAEERIEAEKRLKLEAEKINKLSAESEELLNRLSKLKAEYDKHYSEYDKKFFSTSNNNTSQRCSHYYYFY